VEYPELGPESELRAPVTVDYCRFYYAILDTTDTCFRTGVPVKESKLQLCFLRMSTTPDQFNL